MIPPSEWINADIVFLVTVRFAGHVWRFADRRIVVLDEDGQPIKLRTCETPLDIDESIGRLSQQQRGARAAIRVVLPVDLVAYRRRGFRIDGAHAEVAYVTARQGVAVQPFAMREIIVDGPLREPQYGDPNLPTGTVTASVEGLNTTDTSNVLGDRTFSPFRFPATVSGTLGTADRVRRHDGKGLPVVFGSPGAADRAGSPAYPYEVGNNTLANPTRLVIAGHPVQRQSVTIRDNAGNTRREVIEVVPDLQGELFTSVDVLSTSGLEHDSDQYWISWDPGFRTLPKVGREGGISRVGDLIFWALSRSTLPLDLTSWYAIVPALSALRVNGYINEPISGFEYVSRTFGDILPVAVAGGSGGLRPVLLNAPEVGSVPLVQVSQRFKQAGPWQVQGRPVDVANVVTVSYARDGQQNKATARQVVGTFRNGDTSTSRFSRELYGERHREIELAWTDDATTAALVAKAVIERDGLLGESATYQADLSFGWIRSGDWIRINDARLDVEDLLVQVIARRYLGAAWSFEVLRVDLPQRDAGRVG
tara:strand:+ start:13136 stop:14743 length:1608 start_codon:yes stop_codon:yes gene_type:complete